MERRVALAVAVAMLIAVVADVARQIEPNTWIFRDGRFYVNVNENLLDEGSLQDPFAHSWYDGSLGWNYQLPASFSNIGVGRNGEYWHFRPYLLPVLSTPLYFAFGLAGVLLFNVLGYAVIAAALYRFAVKWATPWAAALGTGAFVFGSGLRVETYNYAVDVLLVAFFACALAALVARRGVLAGALFACAIVIKPPNVLYAIPMAAILWEMRDGKTLVRAVLGGGGALAVAGAINTYMYGRPWWFGYNRALVVVDGEQQVFDDVNAFATPLADGMRELWSGPYGVRDLFGVYLLAAVGVIALARRAPRYVAASVIVSFGMYLLFSKFSYQYERFLLPAFALLVPVLAAGIEASVRVVRRGAIRLRRAVRSPAALGAAAVVIVTAIGSLGSGLDLARRIPDDGYAMAALALGEHGTLDLRSVPGIDGRLAGERSIGSMSRFGHVIPRATIATIAVTTPVGAIFGRAGLLMLHLLAAGLSVWASARVLSRLVGPAIAAVVAVAVHLFGPLQGGAIAGGPAMLGAAIGMLALELALSRRFAWAGALAMLAAWLADAAWLGGLAVVGLAAWSGRRDLIRAVAASGGVLAAWGLSHLIVLGRPFASPDEFVAVARGGSYEAFTVSAPSLGEILERAMAAPSPDRAILALGVAGVLGLVLAAALPHLRARDPRALAALASLFLCALGPSAARAGTALSPLALLGVGLPIALLASAAGAGLDALAHRLATPRRAAIAVAAVLLVLGAIGGVRRTAEAAEPFRMASYLGVRHATVHLDHVPCDFLAWENMSWECSHLDGGARGRAGLALPEGIAVSGEREDMWLVPTDPRGARTRHLEWNDLPAGERLVLRTAIPDGFSRDVQVLVSVDGAEVDRFTVPQDQSRIEERAIDLGAHAGERVTLRISVSALSRGAPAAIALDGGFVAEGGE